MRALSGVGFSHLELADGIAKKVKAYGAPSRAFGFTRNTLIA